LYDRPILTVDDGADALHVVADDAPDVAQVVDERMSGSSWNFDGDLRVDGQTVTSSATS
jgi:hypothetical protein